MNVQIKFALSCFYGCTVSFKERHLSCTVRIAKHFDINYTLLLLEKYALGFEVYACGGTFLYRNILIVIH